MQRELATSAAGEVARDAHLVAQVDGPAPQREVRARSVRGEHHLDLVCALAQVGEDHAAVVAQPDHAPDDGQVAGSGHVAR
ncbi:hypothetical protein D3C74_474710 [compost metagenome]